MKTATKCIGTRWRVYDIEPNSAIDNYKLTLLKNHDDGHSVIVIKESDLQRQIAVMLKAIYVLKRCPQSQEVVGLLGASLSMIEQLIPDDED